MLRVNCQSHVMHCTHAQALMQVSLEDGQDLAHLCCGTMARGAILCPCLTFVGLSSRPQSLILLAAVGPMHALRNIQIQASAIMASSSHASDAGKHIAKVCVLHNTEEEEEHRSAVAEEEEQCCAVANFVCGSAGICEMVSRQKTGRR